MSFCPMRMAMSQVREIDFSGATVLDVRPTSSTLSFSLYEAVVAEGESVVAVDWGDGSVVRYAPDADRRVSLSHTYSRAGTYSVRIQDRLSRLVYSHCTPRFAGTFPEIPSFSFTGARALHGVDSVGSAVQNRTLSYGMFCYTDIESAPSGYSAPLISSVNSSARMVPYGCFHGCANLASVAGLDMTGVVAVDAWAFGGCSSLPDLSAFSGCKLLHVGPCAFSMCKSLKSVDGLSGSALADGRETLFAGASYVKVNGDTLRVLDNGDAIASDLDPDGTLSGTSRYYRVQHFLMGLGERAFEWCLSLESVAALKGFSGVLLPGTFSYCKSLATIPDELVAKQGSGYYQNTYTGGSACYAYVHTGWAPVYAHSSIVPSAPSLGWKWTSGGTFDGCPATNVVKGTFPVVVDGQYKDCTGITDVTFGANAYNKYSIGSNAFSGCTALRAVRFPTQTMKQVKTAGSPDLSGHGCQTNRRGYPFGLPSGCVIYCSDGNLTVP